MSLVPPCCANTYVHTLPRSDKAAAVIRWFESHRGEGGEEPAARKAALLRSNGGRGGGGGSSGSSGSSSSSRQGSLGLRASVSVEALAAEVGARSILAMPTARARSNILQWDEACAGKTVRSAREPGAARTSAFSARGNDDAGHGRLGRAGAAMLRREATAHARQQTARSKMSKRRSETLKEGGGSRSNNSATGRSCASSASTSRSELAVEKMRVTNELLALQVSLN